MIGLKRHTVRVVEHQTGWAMLASGICAETNQACTSLLVDIQHVGSTAVPGLLAKPILDIAAGIATLEVVPKLVGRLTAVGYIYRGDNGNEGGHLFVKESEPDVRTTHCHVVLHNGVQWRNYLAFRELLQANTAVRNQYAALKQRLASTLLQDRASYTKSKREFISEALRQAQALGAEPNKPLKNDARNNARAS